MAPKKPAATAASKKPKSDAPAARHAGQFAPGKSGNPAGRPKGALGKFNMMVAEERAKMADAAGCTPLQFLLSVMLDDAEETAIRVRAATDAAPYFHQKRATKVEVGGQLGAQLDLQSLTALSADDRRVFLEIIERMGVAL